MLQSVPLAHGRFRTLRGRGGDRAGRARRGRSVPGRPPVVARDWLSQPFQQQLVLAGRREAHHLLYHPHPAEVPSHVRSIRAPLQVSITSRNIWGIADGCVPVLSVLTPPLS